MDALSGSRLDLEELEKLLTQASRPRVQKLLHMEIQTIQNDINRHTLESTSKTPHPAAAVHNTTPVTRTKIDLYSWGQSDDVVSLYISDKLKNLKELHPSSVKCQFTEWSVHMEVSNLNGRDFFFHITNLGYPIVPEESSHAVKADNIVLKLKKKNKGSNWECITAAEKLIKDKKKKEKNDLDADAKKDPQASLMNMMKNMYAEGDDEMKRTISKAWYEASLKQNKSPGLDSLVDM